MSLDPAASPWPGVIASVAVCLWIAVIGALLAYAVFRDRPRLVWPFYAPAVGIAVVLLVTNLAAYVMPGAPSAWFGLVFPSALGLVAARRSGSLRPLPPGTQTVLLVAGVLAVGMSALAYAGRLHTPPPDLTWHYPVAFRLALGEFPPVTPYGVDAGIGYHYGANLLAASIVNVAGAFPWTAFDALAALLVAALVLAVAGFAYDIGAPLPLAIGIGATVGFFSSGTSLGYRSGYIENLAFLDLSATPARSEAWSGWLQRTVAMSCVMLVAAALNAGATGRHAAMLAAGAGVLALGDAAVTIFACVALALVGGVRLVRLRGRDRLVFAGALLGSALLVALAGGPVSDAIFDRGGTAGFVRVAWEPIPWGLQPLRQAGPALLTIGVIPLVAIGAIAAFWRRSWGLGFVAAAGALALLESELLQSRISVHDGRIHFFAHAVAMIAALSGVSALIGALRGGGRRLLAISAVVLLVLLPSGLPRAVSGVHLAVKDLEAVDPSVDGSGHHYLDRMFRSEHLAANWEFYEWLRRSLPTGARLLTPYPEVSASATGIASPRSGREMQLLSTLDATHVYHDALRFLHRDDLSTMGITHLHLTDAVASNLDPAAARLLDEPRHFRLLAEISAESGAKHRVYQVLPGGGVPEVSPTSYRALRQHAPRDLPVAVLGSLNRDQRARVLSTFAQHDDVSAASEQSFDRATEIPMFRVATELPDRGLAILPERIEPTALGATYNESVWVSDRMRAYDLASSWSPVWRIGSDRAGLPEPQRPVCESADGEVDLHLLGEPGTRVTAGSTEIALTGLPQIVQLAVPDCGALTLSADSGIAPFVQIRPHFIGGSTDPDSPIAGLGFDGGVDGERAVLNVWYRNPEDIAFTTSTEFRLYLASPLGVDLHPDHSNPRASSLRWWPGPAALYAPEQTARIEFDARRLEINGDTGGGSATSLTPGKTYLLTLNVAGTDPRTGLADIQHIVPVARVVLGEAGVAYEVFSGVVTIEHHEPGTSG